MQQDKQLLIVGHAPSPNTRALVRGLLEGSNHPDIEGVQVRYLPPLHASADQVLQADAILLATTENLGYMSGAMKDFFDRIYYPVLEEKQGLPCALLIRAGLDGTGTRRAIESIVTGLRWQWVQEPLLCHGEWRHSFIDEARDLGQYLAAGLDTGIF